MFVTLVVQVGHLDRDYGTDIVRDGVHVNHFGDVEVRAVAVLLNGRLIGKRHLATQHYKRSSNQHFKQFHFFSVPTMQTIYVFSRIGYGRRLYEAREGGLLGPYGFALRRFVWKLCLVYAYGDFDKSQRLESIVGKTVTIHGRCSDACQGEDAKDMQRRPVHSMEFWKLLEKTLATSSRAWPS